MDVIGIFREILEPGLLAGGLAAVLSGMVQGFSGFGGGLVIVPILALLFGPLQAIAITAIAAFAGNMTLVPGALGRANWREVGPLAIAVGVTIPAGLVFLVSADPVWVRRGMGIFVLLSAALLMSGWSYRGTRGILPSAIAGGLAGGMTGGFGIPGGPFIAVYFLSAPYEPEIQRASIILSIGSVIVFLLGGLIVAGVYTPATLARAALIVPLFIAGNRLGGLLFRRAPARWFKKAAIGILIASGASALLL